MRFHLSVADLFKSEDKIRLTKFLLNHEAAMSEREIASILKISHMSVNRTLQELSELNFVHYLVVGKAHLWEVNRGSFAYRMFIKLFENIEIWTDPLLELKQLLLKKLPLKSILRLVIFGSISKNEEKSDSDIDVFILVKTAADQKMIEHAVEKISGECLRVFGNRFSPYILTESQFRQKQAAALAGSNSTELMEEIYPQGIQIYSHEKSK